MLISRRSFLAGASLGAAAVALPLRQAHAATYAVAGPIDVKPLIARGLEAARAAGASYADVRFERLWSQRLRTRDDHLVDADDESSFGFGVRVIVDGVWGYAASYIVDAESVVRTAQAAVAVAKGNKAASGRPVVLTKVPKVIGKWESPYRVDPLGLAIDKKVAALVDVSRRVVALGGKTAQVRVEGAIEFTRQEKTFGSTDGSLIEQTFVRGQPHLEIIALDGKTGDYEVGSTDGVVPPAQIGWEVMEHFSEAALKAAEGTMRRLGAKPVDAGKYDLVIAPSNLWLTVHESVGHPTELDRALGYEANFAGTSFARPSDRGKMKYGADIVNIVADRTQAGALATCGWDDDGDVAQRWDLIKDGMLVGFQTTREQAAWIGESTGHATSYAQSWSAVPFQRMPNVSLLPGKKRLTPGELIADTKRGIYVEGNGSWSIDQQRYNFQFGAQAFTLIENGKLTKPLRSAAYQSNSRDFWGSCDAICDERDYRLGGSLHDGKGEPGQSNPVSHGSSTSRFRQVNVLNVRKS